MQEHLESRSKISALSPYLNVRESTVSFKANASQPYTVVFTRFAPDIEGKFTATVCSESAPVHVVPLMSTKPKTSVKVHPAWRPHSDRFRVNGSVLQRVDARTGFRGTRVRNISFISLKLWRYVVDYFVVAHSFPGNYYHRAREEANHEFYRFPHLQGKPMYVVFFYELISRILVKKPVLDPEAYVFQCEYKNSATGLYQA